MSKFKTALVVGGGAMAVDQHIPRLTRLLAVEQITLFDVDRCRQIELVSRFNRNNAIAVVDVLPSNQKFDLVVIATPPKFHFEYFSKLIDVSDQFLIEKPMTLNGREAADLVRLADRKKKTVYVNLIRRTLKSYELIRKFLCKGSYGPLSKAAINEGGVYNWKAVSLGSFSRDLNGGGVLMDTGPHTLDLLFQVFQKLTLVEARVDGKFPAIEANCQLILTADDEFPITVNLSRNRHLSNNSVFSFDNAELTVGVMGEAITVQEKDGSRYQISAVGAKNNETWGNFVDNYYIQFLEPGISHGISASDSEKIAMLIDEAYAKAKLIDLGF